MMLPVPCSFPNPNMQIERGNVYKAKAATNRAPTAPIKEPESVAALFPLTIGGPVEEADGVAAPPALDPVA